MVKWAIALHGGAGVIPRDSLSPEMKQKVEDALRGCLDAGIAALRSPSASALDAVEIVVRALENNPLFNAGRGSVLTEKETIEMEACIMDGKSKQCGAVSGLATVVNPISLARRVMEKTPHIYLGFEGAHEFARQQGVELAGPEYFRTETRLQQLRATKAEQCKSGGGEVGNGPEPELMGEEDGRAGIAGEREFVGETVGCVAVDGAGNCAAATSTGGLTNKMAGRIGDTPIVGAGTYADVRCAVSATGVGEAIMRATVGRDVAAVLEFKQTSLSDAVRDVVWNRAPAGTTGLVAVSSAGDIAMDFNTPGMYRAAADEDGRVEVAIWR